MDELKDIKLSNEPFDIEAPLNLAPQKMDLQQKFCIWPNQRGVRKGKLCGKEVFSDSQYCSAHAALVEKKNGPDIMAQLRSLVPPVRCVEDEFSEDEFEEEHVPQAPIIPQQPKRILPTNVAISYTNQQIDISIGNFIFSFIQNE